MREEFILVTHFNKLAASELNFLTDQRFVENENTKWVLSLLNAIKLKQAKKRITDILSTEIKKIKERCNLTLNLKLNMT